MRVNYKPALISLGLLVLWPPLVLAANVDALRSQINDRNDQIKKLEAEIATYQQQLDQTSKQSNTLKNEVSSLDTTLKNLNAQVQLTSAKIAKTNLTLTALGGEIGDKEATIGRERLALGETMRQLRANESNSAVLMLLGTNSLSAFWREGERLANLSNSLRNQVAALRGLKQDLENKQTEQAKNRDSLTKLKGQLADQQKVAAENRETKNKLLAATKNQEANYKKLLADRKRLAEAFEAELRDYESQLKFILDPKSLPQPGSTPLAWPLVNISISQLFGKTVDAARLYASGSHSGVDFRAPVGTPVFGLAGGTVLGTGDTDPSCPGVSFGKWIFVKYGNGLAATFAHLSLIKVSLGDPVTPSTIIGYSGNTGRSTGPHLHLTVYAATAVEVAPKESLACPGAILTQPRAPLNAYLDPMLYLPSL